MRISIKSYPIMDKDGDFIDYTTVEVAGDDPTDNPIEVAQMFKKVIKELKEDK